MIKILTFAPAPGDGTSFYRLSGVLPFLEREYSDIRVTDISSNQKLDWNTFSGHDILIFQRPFSEQHFAAIKMARNMGLKIILDYDDDLFNIPKENPVYVNFSKYQEQMAGCCKVADVIWVSTESIKRSISQYNKNIIIIPNAHNDYLLPVKNKMEFNYETKSVAYRGGVTHEVDVYSAANDWAYIINNNKDFEFYFIGARFPYLETMCGNNYNVMMGMHIIDYIKFFKNLNPNIFIYTLQDNPFNSAKSNISWIEATYAGAAFIGPEFLPEFARPGIVHYNKSMSTVFENIKDEYRSLAIVNGLSWDYIVKNLLLSSVNNLRYQSILGLQK